MSENHDIEPTTPLHQLAKEWERKANVLDEMALNCPNMENRARQFSKAGAYRSAAVDLRRALREQDRNSMQLRKWISEAAPMLSRACEIVVEDSPQRLGEIAGFRGILEECPVEAGEWKESKP